MPLPLLPIIIAAIIGLTVVILAIIYYDEIIRWFQSRNDIKEADKDNIAFTIKKRLETGDYKVVQGIFNKRTEDLVDGHAMQSETLDEELEQVHSGHELVIYQ